MDRADAQPPRPRGHRRARLRVRLRAEDRRAGDLAAVSRRRVRARRHARQRRGRRGRHAQPAHDRRDPAQDRGRAGAARGARRGLHVAAGLHGAQRAAGRAGAEHLHEPAQQRGGNDSPARPGAGGRAPALDVVLRHRRHRRALLRAPLGRAAVAARPRLPRQRRHQDARRRGRGRRPVPALATATRRARLRDRRGRGQGRRHRAAAPARRRRSRPALGDRLEVPAHDRRHAVERDQLERRQVRRPAPVRGARAGPRGRRDGQGRDAAQRRGPRAQGRPPGRRRDRPARGRRDPAGRLTRPARGRARGPGAAAAGPRALPVLRHAHGQGRGRRLHPLPEPRLSRAPLAAADRVRARDGHRRPGREAGRALPAPGARPDRGRLLPAAAGAAARARRLRRGERQPPALQHRGLAGTPVRHGAVRDRHRGRRVRHRPQPRAAVPHGRRAAGRHARADRRDPGHRPGRRAPDPLPARRSATADRRAARRPAPGGGGPAAR